MQAGPGLRRFIPALVLVATLQAVAAAAGVVPLIAAAEIGRGLLSPDPITAGAVWTLLVAGAAGVCLRLVCEGAAAGLGHRLDGDVQYALRRRLADHLGRTPLGWLTRQHSGALTKRLGDDVSALHPFIAHTPGQLAAAFVAPAVAAAYLLTIDWRLTLVALVPSVLAIAHVPLMTTRARAREQQDLDRARERIASAAVEFVQGIAVVKAFGSPRSRHREFQRAVDDFTGVFSRWVRAMSAIAAGMQLALSPVFVIFTVLVGGTALVAGGTLPPQDVLPFLLLGVGLTAPVAALGHGFDEALDARHALGRLRQTLSTPLLAEPPDPGQPRGSRIEVRRVRFGYSPDSEVLRGVDLTLEPGTVTALVGPSGSGKSTLARLLPRFYDPDAGSITLGGIPLDRLSSRTLSSQISFVFQDVRLIRGTVRDNIALGAPDATAKQVEHAARLANIHERILDLPHGYDTVLANRTGLSGGEAQRVTLARALLADPPVLVLDEATAFADPATDVAVRRALADYRGGRTDRSLLVIAHRLETVVGADQVVLLEDGVVAARGAPQDLLAEPGRFADFWASRRSASSPQTPQNPHTPTASSSNGSTL